MGDHIMDYQGDPELEKMFHNDLSQLDLHDHDSDSSDVISAHLPEWLIGVIIVIIMLIVAFFVMVITSLIRKRKKGQSSLPGETVSSAVTCDDLESGKIGQTDVTNSKSVILSSCLKDKQEADACPPEKDFTSTSHRALEEVSSQAGCSCRNPLFVDDEEQSPKENQQIPQDGAVSNEEIVVTSASESCQSKGSPQKHKSSRVISTISENETFNTCFNSPTSPSRSRGNYQKNGDDTALHEVKTFPKRFSSSCHPCDTLSEQDEVFDESNNDSCQSISSCSDGTDENNKDHSSHQDSHPDDNLTSLENQPIRKGSDSEVALNSLEIMETARNRIDEEDIEKDTGIISTNNRDKSDHSRKSSCTNGDDKAWFVCNGHSLQDVDISHKVSSVVSSDGHENNGLDDDVTDGPDGASTMNDHHTINSSDSCFQDNHVNENNNDSLSTNL